MASKDVEFHEAAALEYEAAFQWYFERNPKAASRFAADLDRAIALISEAPQRWSAGILGTRRFFLQRFPFAVVYRELPSVIQVLAVAHGHRRPGYLERTALTACPTRLRQERPWMARWERSARSFLRGFCGGTSTQSATTCGAKQRQEHANKRGLERHLLRCGRFGRGRDFGFGLGFGVAFDLALDFGFDLALDFGFGLGLGAGFGLGFLPGDGRGRGGTRGLGVGEGGAAGF